MVSLRESPTLHPQIIGQVETIGEVGFYMYWRLPNGWIAPAPAHQTEWARRVKSGQAPLTEYGQFVYSRRAIDADGRTWDARAEPWRLIFQKSGAEAFTVEQVIAHRWHIRPPYREVTFPQLEGVEYEIYECPECDSAVFTSLNIGFAPIDLTRHLRLGHGYGRAEISEYARDLGLKFKHERRILRARQLVTPVSNVGEPVEAPERNPAHKCGVCGWMPLAATKNPVFALAGHTRAKHKNAKPDA